MNTPKENNLPKIGYLYHYPRLEEKDDDFRLDIFVSPVTTELHFDVARAFFFVATSGNTIEKFKVGHAELADKNYQVCAGMVVMEDRNQEKKEAFTFGGKLSIETQEAQTMCVLTSPAPILDLADATPLERIFIEELEIIFAERAANYANHHDYEKDLIAANPRDLYLATLEALLAKFENFPRMDQSQRDFLHFLRAEKNRLYAAGISTELAPSLDKIFPAQ